MTSKRKSATDRAADLTIDAACKHAIVLIRAGQSPVAVLTAAGVAAGVLLGAS